MKTSIFIVILLVFIGCGEDLKQENESLKHINATLSNEKQVLTIENESLKKEIDEVKNGSLKMFALAKKQYDDRQFVLAVQSFKNLIIKHPLSKEANDAKELIISSEREIKKEADELVAKNAKQEKELKDRIAKATAKMKAKHDEIGKITFYSHKDLENRYTGGIDLYIAKPDASRAFLRLKNTYYGDNWLFVRSFIIVADEVQYPFHLKFERDNGSGSVWEWNDMLIQNDAISMIESIINSKKATIRFVGDKYHKDHIVSQKEKQCMRDVLDAFKAL